MAGEFDFLDDFEFLDEPQDVPAPRPAFHMKGHQIQDVKAPTPRGKTFLADAPTADVMKLGLKAKDEDRLKGAQELYPDSIVEQINDGSVVVRRPTGEVYNFERPDMMHSIVGTLRGAVGLDGDQNATQARAERENDYATAPEFAIRAIPSAIAATATGGASLLPHVLTQTAAGAASEIPRTAINAVTAGGEGRNSAEIVEDAQREGLTAGAATAALGLAAKPFRSAADSIKARLGIKSAASRDITRQLGGGSEGSPSLTQAVDDINALGVADKDIPLSTLERANPKAGPRLKEIYSDPKVTDEAAFLERRGQEAVRDAGEQAIRDAKAGQRYDVEFGRKARNLAIKEIKQSDPVLDAELSAAKPREIRDVLNKNIAPGDPRLEKLDTAWNELDAARRTAKQGVDAPEIAGPKATMRAVKESGKVVKPDKHGNPIFPKPVKFAMRVGADLATAGLAEVPGLAAKFARFARGDKVARKLITSPEVRLQVLDMLQKGIPEQEISRWLISGAATGAELTDKP